MPAERLRGILDAFLATADWSALLARDPLALVAPYPDPADREVVGLVVAALAYGRVASIQAKAAQALECLGPRPARAIADPRRRRRLEGFVYRFQKGDDLPRFLAAVHQVREAHGSLARAFAAAVDPQEPNYAGALGRWVAQLKAAAGPLSYGLGFLLPDPAGGGAAKRLWLYLRWMIRDEGVDLGTWRTLAPGLVPAHLIIPLDTHVARIGRYLGLTERRSDDLRTAIEITQNLALLAPHDPLRYDMALCHLGISGRCPRRRDPAACAGCPIRLGCRLGPEPPGW